MTDEEMIEILDDAYDQAAQNILQSINPGSAEYLADLIPDLLDKQRLDERELKANQELSWAKRRALCKKVAKRYIP